MIYYERVMTREGYAYDEVDFGQILRDARLEGRQETIIEIKERLLDALKKGATNTLSMAIQIVDDLITET